MSTSARSACSGRAPGHQVAVELGEDEVALAQLAKHPGFGFEEGALAQAEKYSNYDTRSRFHEDARRRDSQHDHEVALRMPRGSDRQTGNGKSDGHITHRVVIDMHDLVDLDHP